MIALAVACGGGETRHAPRSDVVTISVIGTNDVHGHVEQLPLLAGYVAIVRELRAADGGAVVLLDAGDMFQGTLESNLNEGAAMVDAYGALGYAAAAVGNHEFDFGPVGPAATPRAAGDDPRGALRARAAQARQRGFALLAANLADAATGARVDWPELPATLVVERAGVRIGIIGVTTIETPRTTLATNFEGLAVTPLAPAIARAAAELRAGGADVVLVAAHAGGRCEHHDDPDDLSSCAADAEIFAVARALPPGAVDAIVAGHSHAGVAHRVAGIPVIEAYSRAAAFGRVDLRVDRAAGAVVGARIHPPRWLCAEPPPAACAPGDYEGRAVAPDDAIARAVAPAIAAARDRRAEPLGVEVAAPIRAAYGEESALGNLVADLMRAARPAADVAITNGGGLRADLPAGTLSYGALYEALPFDNTFALERVTGAGLRRMVADNLAGTHGIFSLSGVRAVARCDGATLTVDLQRPDGTPIADDDAIVVATSNFLAAGGDGALAHAGATDIHIEDDPPIRDAVADMLRARGGTLRGDDAAIFDPERPRLVYPGTRPVRCP